MKLGEIENSLPNGFHDAKLDGIEVDYTTRTAVMRMRLHTGDPHAALEAEREAYSRAELAFSGILYFVIDPPDQKYPYSEKDPIWLDAGDAVSDRGSVNPAPLPLIPASQLPAGAFAYWFFVHNWNSFIHVAAADAKLIWLETPTANQKKVRSTKK